MLDRSSVKQPQNIIEKVKEHGIGKKVLKKSWMK